ncbi:Protein fmp52, mitochondrial [Taxawa tesnikishii (nom. ined.)]|nr:Protein fmp52, mitochondrial [Dothideales sp. JES 119]
MAMAAGDQDQRIVLAGWLKMQGSNILATLVDHPSFSSIQAFSRRELPVSSSKLQPLISTDSSKWPSLWPHFTNLFISALGTTRGQAGSFQNQYKIDHDLNLELAKAAKAAGELEEDVKALGFEHTVILRPGVILGERTDSRPPEWVVRKIFGAAGSVSTSLMDFFAQDALVIARAAVAAGLKCQEGKVEERVWQLASSDIVRLGRTEWSGQS